MNYITFKVYCISKTNGRIDPFIVHFDFMPCGGDIESRIRRDYLGNDLDRVEKYEVF